MNYVTADENELLIAKPKARAQQMLLPKFWRTLNASWCEVAVEKWSGGLIILNNSYCDVTLDCKFEWLTECFQAETLPNKRQGCVLRQILFLYEKPNMILSWFFFFLFTEPKRIASDMDAPIYSKHLAFHSLAVMVADTPYTEIVYSLRNVPVSHYSLVCSGPQIFDTDLVYLGLIRSSMVSFQCLSLILRMRGFSC